jgi:hypothetical protein
MAPTTWRKHAAAAAGSGGRIPAGGQRPSPRASRGQSCHRRDINVVLTRAHTGSVIVDWTDEFDRWLTNAEEHLSKLLELAGALLQALNDL